VTSTDDDSGYDGSEDSLSLLAPDESLDDDELDDDVEETGYSPLDWRPADLSWGFTEREARGHEPLAARLAREVPDDTDDIPGDGIGDTVDTDGEIIDDQVGSIRAGRLIWADEESFDRASEYWANDIGIDGGGASAEEAAVNIVLESDDQL
jgi:hypothetical protein